MGQVFHAVGPNGEGDAALAEAVNWPDVTLSFDEKAQLPSKQTITKYWQPQVSGVSDTKSSSGSETLPPLSDNRRIVVANFVFLGAGCLFFLAALVLIGAAVLSKIWLALYFRYRIIFLRAAVAVQDGLAKADIPRVVDAPNAGNRSRAAAGIHSGEKATKPRKGP